MEDKTYPTLKRKNTAKWCRGKQGVEHIPAIVPNSDFLNQLKLKDCLEFAKRSNGQSGTCLHRIECTVCSKILTQFLPIEECPDLNPHNQ